LASRQAALRFRGISIPWLPLAGPLVTTNHQEVDVDRKYLDCREMPSENNCDLAMSGSEGHLVEAGAIHAITAHKHEDTPELREQIRGLMKDEVPTALV
jgi:hypothetical protein